MTTGDPLMTKRLEVACTTLANTKTVTVGNNERWVVLQVYIENCTLSSGASVIQIQAQDVDGSGIGLMAYKSASSGEGINAFAEKANTRIAQYPLVLYEGQKIYFYWGASANKSGNGAYYINALQFKVGIE